MRRTEQVQGLRLMKFEEVYGRTHRGGLSQAEAAEVLGVSERTFRRWRDRYEAEGADGLYDRRLGRLSARRAPVRAMAMWVLPVPVPPTRIRLWASVVNCPVQSCSISGFFTADIP